jgi:hypothetical protein
VAMITNISGVMVAKWWPQGKKTNNINVDHVLRTNIETLQKSSKSSKKLS